MKFHTRLMVTGVLLLLLTFAFAACGPKTASPVGTGSLTQAPSSAPDITTEPALEIVGPQGSTALTLDEIKAMPATEGYAGTKSSTGKITVPDKFKGVSLKELAAKAGGMDNDQGFNVVAKDGYAITFSFDQINQGTFTAYDPATGDELKSPDPLVAILAYEQNGKPLNPDTDGTLRLVIISDKPNQVTDGHWAVKWAMKLEAKSLVREWTLHLMGAISAPVDRSTFEACSAPQCHGSSWVDDKAQKWVGVPLWRFVGSVDDEIKHEGAAFNDSLADAGYQVEVVGSDGYTVTFDSKRLKRNNDILVAYMVNDNPLPDKYFPLRLVGKDLQKSEMAGAVEKILVHVPEPATATPVAASPSAGALVVSGLVGNPTTLTEAGLRALQVATISAEQPKKGMQTFNGVRLSTLMALAQVKPEATKAVFTASDGYSSEIDLPALQACSDCIVAFTDTPGTYFLVMPGQAGNFWVMNITGIEFK